MKRILDKRCRFDNMLYGSVFFYTIWRINSKGKNVLIYFWRFLYLIWKVWREGNSSLSSSVPVGSAVGWLSLSLNPSPKGRDFGFLSRRKLFWVATVWKSVYGINFTTLSAVQFKIVHSFSSVFMVMELLRFKLVIVWGLKPCLFIRA